MTSSAVNHWQLHKSVLDSNKYMLDNQLYCDVTFVFGEESEKVTLPANVGDFIPLNNTFPSPPQNVVANSSFGGGRQ